jgi:hypothetical protein
MRTRVCRLAALALTIVALGPREMAAEPLLGGVGGGPCPGLPGTQPLGNCGLFSLEPLPTQTLSGSFSADNEVALFQFILAGAAGVSAFTSGYETTGFDSLIGLFNGTTGTILSYFSMEQGDDVDAENDDISSTDFNSALPVILLDPGTYILALLQTGNNFNSVNGIDSLLAGFSGDIDPIFPSGTCAGGCEFSLSLTVDSGETPAPIPEPGTLSLVALGSAAALARRFRKRERQH